MKWDTFKDDYFVAVETGKNGHLWQTQEVKISFEPAPSQWKRSGNFTN